MPSTKIVCTLGPATDTDNRVRDLILAGMNVARLNFSHGTHADHVRRITQVRRVAAELGKPIGILQDLSGPKIRTGKHENGECFTLTAGESLTITTDDVLGTPGRTGTPVRVSTSYTQLPNDVKVGNRILLSDGSVELLVEKVTDTEVQCQVCNDSVLRQRQGINLPGIHVSAPTVTPKDIADLHFGLEQGVDYVALSFVRWASDIKQINELIATTGGDQPVIAKIERPEALDELAAILAEAGGVMVARGDLGVELPIQDVTMIQKHIISQANYQSKPVITATQMLESMVHNPSPTRAEVSDVANAIIDGSDAVMLSAETSIGDYPVQAVQMMTAIAQTVEDENYEPIITRSEETSWVLHAVQSPSQAIGTAVTAICRALPVDAILVFTQSGYTARMLSHYRPEVPIIALTPNDRVYRQMALLWGVTPIKSPYYSGSREFWADVVPTVLKHRFVQPGDTVVVTGGHPLEKHGSTNFLKIMEIEEAN